MSEETPLVRQWIMLRKLSALHYGATVKEMVDEMGVSEKTIRRDLESFQRAGYPLSDHRGSLYVIGFAQAFDPEFWQARRGA